MCPPPTGYPVQKKLLNLFFSLQILHEGMEDLGNCAACPEAFKDVTQMHTCHGCQGKIHSSVVYSRKRPKVAGHEEVYIYIHHNTPFRVRIRIHIRDRNSPAIHLLCQAHASSPLSRAHSTRPFRQSHFVTSMMVMSPIFCDVIHSSRCDPLSQVQES